MNGEEVSTKIKYLIKEKMRSATTGCQTKIRTGRRGTRPSPAATVPATI
jgi:hypothetical protein